jgi:hypothetical protein
MSETMMMSPSVRGEKFANRKHRLGQAQALQRLVCSRWPRGTRDQVRYEWDLTEQEARAVSEGRASKATLDRIYQHERGGLLLGLLVLEEVAGTRLDSFIASERSRHAYGRGEDSVVALARNLRAALGVGRRDDPSDGRRPFSDDCSLGH